MYIVSTSKKTILSDFADLETKSTFLHANGEATDFQFNAQRCVFVEVDKKAGLTVMRIKEKQENVPEIQRVRKLTIENAYSVCCAKTACNQIAIGQSSGFVKLFNFSTAQLIHSYPADKSSSTVLYVDYNCTDDYIAAVLEGGQINIYGTRTKQKMESITIDEYSTLARFHPSKRFHLGVASFKGTVTVYDVQAKRSIFHLEDAHDAPCRDVSMCSGQPSLLVSVGYDCKINIFDIRRNKAQAPSGRLEYTHPMSTVALSECGTYFCAGNLKGELVSYDMRSTKAPLAVRSVHDGCAVTRCAFVPTPTEEQQSSSFSSSNSVTMDVGGGKTVKVEPMPHDELRKSISANLLLTQQQLDSLATPKAARQTRDSFCDFLDAQRPHDLNRMSTQMTKTTKSTRDSFDWESLQSKANNEELRQTIYQNGCGLSSLDSAASSTADSLQQTLSGSLGEGNNISVDAKLKRIIEADEQDELIEQSVNCSATSSSAASDKANPQLADMELSAPTNLSSNTSPGKERAEEHPQEQDELDDRFAKLERELKWSAEKTRFTTFFWIAKYWNQQLENTQDTCNAINQLLQRDRFANNYFAVQKKNEMLKQQLKQLISRQEMKGDKSVNA
ncbi:GH11178 [Drosophila grimshawi]|uniref:GH11178 n=1 Tax=Drosophila grimshawi TaxID=7222 RepID=B4JDF6_DROGR|nr:GH11178 [Drosophila grimshawi]